LTPLTARLLFFAEFVVAAAVLFFLWKVGAAWAYGYAVLVPVTVLSPLLTGYQVIIGTGAHGITAFFEGGGSRIEVPFVLHEALAGVIPFAALMCASSRQTLRQWASRTAIGLGVIYLAHVIVLTLSPLLVTEHARWISKVIDVTYGFYAVAGFVGLPFSLWVILTRPWEFSAGSPQPEAVPAAAEVSASRPQRAAGTKRKK
jgi:hypothetical protein